MDSSYLKTHPMSYAVLENGDEIFVENGVFKMYSKADDIVCATSPDDIPMKADIYDNGVLVKLRVDFDAFTSAENIFTDAPLRSNRVRPSDLGPIHRPVRSFPGPFNPATNLLVDNRPVILNHDHLLDRISEILSYIPTGTYTSIGTDNAPGITVLRVSDERYIADDSNEVSDVMNLQNTIAYISDRISRGSS